MLVYRLCKVKYASDLSGIGSEICGGRWNLPGTKALYTSEHFSLAILEVAVHVDKDVHTIPYSKLIIDIPDDPTLYTTIDANAITSNWAVYSSLDIVAAHGNALLKSNDFLGLIVPSVVARGEYNYILNPLHPRYREVSIVNVLPYKFDERIKTSSGGGFVSYRTIYDAVCPVSRKVLNKWVSEGKVASHKDGKSKQHGRTYSLIDVKKWWEEHNK